MPRSVKDRQSTMDESHDFQIVRPEQNKTRTLAKADPSATPFKVVIDPKVRMELRRALVDLIDYHDDALADHFAQGKLTLEDCQGTRAQLDGSILVGLGPIFVLAEYNRLASEVPGSGSA